MKPVKARYSVNQPLHRHSPGTTLGTGLPVVAAAVRADRRAEAAACSLRVGRSALLQGDTASVRRSSSGQQSSPYDYGYRQAASGHAWHKVPPGTSTAR
jgi:hypothetical protein